MQSQLLQRIGCGVSDIWDGLTKMLVVRGWLKTWLHISQCNPLVLSLVVLRIHSQRHAVSKRPSKLV